MTLSATLRWAAVCALFTGLILFYFPAESDHASSTVGVSVPGSQ